MLALRLFSTTRVCAACPEDTTTAGNACAPCPRQPIDDLRPVRAWTGNDVLILSLVTTSVAVVGWLQPVLGCILGFLLFLVALRTWSALGRSGRRGIVPHWGQKVAVSIRAVRDVVEQGMLSLYVLATGFFCYALGWHWDDVPDMANLSMVIGTVLMALGAPGLVLYLYAQLQPITIAQPRPTPWWLEWIAGLTALAIVNATVVLGVLYSAERLPRFYAALLAEGVMLSLLWGNWGALLELRTGMTVGLLRAISLVVRGLLVLLESLLMGSAFVAAGLLLMIVAANGTWGTQVAVVIRVAGLAIGLGLAPLAVLVCWWQRRPRLVRLRVFAPGEMRISRDESWAPNDVRLATEGSDDAGADHLSLSAAD